MKIDPKKCQKCEHVQITNISGIQKKIELKFLDSEIYKLNKEVLLLRHVLGLHPAIHVYKLMSLANTLSQFHHRNKMMHGKVFNKRDLDKEITRF